MTFKSNHSIRCLGDTQYGLYIQSVLAFGILTQLSRASSSLKMAAVFSVGNVLPYWRNMPSNIHVLAAREFNSKAAKAIWDLNGKPDFEP